MKIVSLGNNCFWGLLSKDVNIQQNLSDFFAKTNFLTRGIISVNNNKYVTAIDALHHFLVYCDSGNFLWLNYENVSYRSSRNSTARNWINYYWYGNKTMPIFFRHIDDVYLDNPDFFKIVHS